MARRRALDCHEPGELHREPGDDALFAARAAERDELAARIVHSEGGANLVTGYRGVGKTERSRAGGAELVYAFP